MPRARDCPCLTNASLPLATRRNRALSACRTPMIHHPRTWRAWCFALAFQSLSANETTYIPHFCDCLHATNARDTLRFNEFMEHRSAMWHTLGSNRIRPNQGPHRADAQPSVFLRFHRDPVLVERL